MAVDYPTSWTEVCNLALGRLGAKQITTLLEGTPNANYCSQFLGQAIEQVLGEHDWIGATKRQSLNRLGDTPAFGYAYIYALPADFIRSVEVIAGLSPYRIEEPGLLTDADEVQLVYIARPELAPAVPQYLRRAFTVRLAFLLTTPLTSSEELAARVMAEDTQSLQRAVEADGKNTSEQTLDSPRGYTYYDELR